MLRSKLMGAPKADIDRDAVATCAAIHGVRPTARKMGVSVPMVQRIVKAAGVSLPDPLMRPAQRITDVRPIQVDTMPPSHAIVSDEVSNNGARGRLTASRIGADQLEAVANTMTADPSFNAPLVDSALTAGKLLQTANVPGWERQQQAGSGVNLLVHGNAQVLVQGPTAPE